MLNLAYKVYHKIQVIQQTVQHAQHAGQFNRYNIQPVMFTANEVRHDICERTKDFSKVLYSKKSILKHQYILINKMAICNKSVLSHTGFAVLDPSNDNNLLVYTKTRQSCDVEVPFTEYNGINELKWQKVDPVVILYKNLYNSYLCRQPYGWRLGPNESLDNNKFCKIMNKGDKNFTKFNYQDLEYLNLHIYQIQEYSKFNVPNKLVYINGYDVSFTNNLLNYNKQVGIISPKEFAECMQDYETYKNDYNLIMARCGADLGL
jgi:hypothetical protein